MLNSSLFNKILLANLLQGLTLIQFLDSLFQILESKNQYCYIIKRSTCCSFTQSYLYSFSRSNMLVVEERWSTRATHLLRCASGVHILWRQVIISSWCGLLWDTVPNRLNCLFIIHSFINTVTTNQEEIKVRLQFESLDLWLAHNNIWITTILLSLSLNVTKCSGYWETTWEYSQRTLDVKIFFIWGRCSFSQCLGSIYLSSSCLDSNPFLFIIRLVVPWENGNLGSSIKWH